MLRRIQEALCQDKEILGIQAAAGHLLTANIGMWKHYVFRFGRKRWYKPAKKNSRGESAEELRYYKARHIGGPNPGKGAVNARASVTAGLAKEVEAVNQYAPVM